MFWNIIQNEVMIFVREKEPGLLFYALFNITRIQVFTKSQVKNHYLVGVI